MLNTGNYTITEITNDTEPTAEVVDLIVYVMRRSGELYDWAFDSYNFKMSTYLARQGGHMFLARRDGKPVGLLLARLLPSVFDHQTRILYQDLLHVKPGNPRAAYFLMQYLIDFGRRNANHVITMIAAETNLKPRSLEKLGFTKLETLYRMRV